LDEHGGSGEQVGVAASDAALQYEEVEGS
jgi:hypothetical protein